jgi:putative ABC transport system permease protein
MLLTRAIAIALHSMWGSKLRTFLTLLGIIIGVFSVVATASVIQGLNRFVASEILGTGSHSFNITKFGFITDLDSWIKAQRRRDLTIEDAEFLQRKMESASAVVAQASSRRKVRGAADRGEGAQVLGTQEAYPEVGQYPLGEGRHLTGSDVRQRHAVCVVGHKIKEELLNPGDPLGQRLRVGGHTLRVVGVLSPRGAVLGVSQDDIVILPITTYQKMFGRRESVEISVKAKGPALFQEAQDEAMLWTKVHRGLKPYDEPDFDILTSEMLYSFYEQITGLLFLGMLGVVGLSLLVGGIVIMNIMLVAVAERTREIGVRRALGARVRDIILQFLVESATLSALGGVIGVMVGAGLALLIRTLTPLPVQIAPVTMIAGLIIAIGVGMVFGLYPAYRASRLDPIQALGHEV